MTRHEEWYERLGQWHDALKVYSSKTNTDCSEVRFGKIKCYHALGDWDQLATLIDEAWGTADNEFKEALAPVAAATAWSLQEWKAMEDYISAMKGDSLDRAFYRGILYIHHHDLQRGFQQISKARDLLVPVLIKEGYSPSSYMRVLL